MLSDIANWFVVAVIVWIIYWKWEMFRLTRIPWVGVIMIAFVTLLAVRVGVAAGQPFIAAHSRALTTVTVLLLGVGIPMLVVLLRKAYKLNGNGKPIADTIAEIKRAADSAQDARTHAIDAAEAARVAAVHAVEAAKLADRATALSRIATREAGVADEASRAADDQVTRKDEP